MIQSGDSNLNDNSNSSYSSGSYSNYTDDTSWNLSNGGFVLAAYSLNAKLLGDFFIPLTAQFLYKSWNLIDVETVLKDNMVLNGTGCDLNWKAKKILKKH